eukprot:14071254-Ditylum_brightwellii.AAC.1
MEKVLMEHHKTNFSQAEGTLLTKSSLKDLIGYTAEGPLAKQLKDGTANIKEIEVDEYTKD